MSGGRLYLRKATRADAGILFEWANNREVRRNAFDSHAIAYGEHMAWFGAVLNDGSQAQYILMLGDQPVGQARIAVKGTEAEVDYSISESARGCGYGGELIGLIKERARQDYPFVQKLAGRVKPSNAASCRCFMKNGFEEACRQFEYSYQ